MCKKDFESWKLYYWTQHVQNPRYRTQDHPNRSIINNLCILVVSSQNITFMAAILNFQPFGHHFESWKLFFWTQHIQQSRNRAQGHPNRPIINNSMKMGLITWIIGDAGGHFELPTWHGGVNPYFLEVYSGSFFRVTLINIKYTRQNLVPH